MHYSSFSSTMFALTYHKTMHIISFIGHILIASKIKNTKLTKPFSKENHAHPDIFTPNS